MEMRAASNAQLRVTGVSFIPAWWCSSRGQVVRLVRPTGGCIQNAATVHSRAGAGASSPHLWLNYEAAQANQSADDTLDENGQPETRDKGKGFGGLAITKLVERKSRRHWCHGSRLFSVQHRIQQSGPHSKAFQNKMPLCDHCANRSCFPWH